MSIGRTSRSSQKRPSVSSVPCRRRILTRAIFTASPPLCLRFGGLFLRRFHFRQEALVSGIDMFAEPPDRLGVAAGLERFDDVAMVALRTNDLLGTMGEAITDRPHPSRNALIGFDEFAILGRFDQRSVKGGVEDLIADGVRRSSRLRLACRLVEVFNELDPVARQSDAQSARLQDAAQFADVAQLSRVIAE